MKLRNKKTGRVLTKYSIRTLEGVDADKGTERIVLIDDETNDKWYYDTLAEFNAWWEDYEEPKETALEEMIKKLESDFKMYPDEWNNLEEAKQITSKLKAWKRLKDKGFKFKGWAETDAGKISIYTQYKHINDTRYFDQISHDLDILCGGEE